MKPFLKWAGGKRWLAGRSDFSLPEFTGNYIEPFLGGAAVFFKLRPEKAILSDINARLIETYIAIRDNYLSVWKLLEEHQERHSKEYYYLIRGKAYTSPHERAAQFIYLNRACWNGLYRENLKGEFNVPIGTKSTIIFQDDDFSHLSKILKRAKLFSEDFEKIISQAAAGDFIFADPPYTTAHNVNGFVKYNEKIFTWDDQIRLAKCLKKARDRGVLFYLTNANHESIRELYDSNFKVSVLQRHSVIAGSAGRRSATTELLITA